MKTANFEVRKFFYEHRETNKVCKMAYNGDLRPSHLGDIDYIGFSNQKPEYISYLTDDRIKRITEAGDDLWDPDKRFHGKPGKIIRKLFTKAWMDDNGIKDTDIEDFANLVKSERLIQFLKMELVKGEDIRKYYHERKYATLRGTLGGSCMRGEAHQEYLDIYVKNPKTVSMAILKDESEDKIYGRAIVWKANDVSIMDRIYYTDDYIVDVFTKYAKENGMLHKAKQAHSTIKTFVNPEGETIEQEFRIDLTTGFETYPYMDTFISLHPGSLTNDSTGRILDCTGGNRDEETHSCYHCGENIHDEDDVRWDADGEPSCPDCVNYCEDENEYYHESDTVYCDYHGFYVHQENAVRVDGHGWYWTESPCLTKIDDTYYHEDDVVYSERDSQSYPEAEAVWIEEIEDYVHQDDEDDVRAEIEAETENA